MNKISKKNILIIVLLVVLGAGLVVGCIFGLNSLQTTMNIKRVELLAKTDPARALTELQSTGIEHADLEAYLRVMVLAKEAMDETLTTAEVMDKLTQLCSTAETAIAANVLSEEHNAAVTELLIAARGAGACDAEPYASLQKLLEYSTSMLVYSYRLKMGLEFTPSALSARLTALTDGYDALYAELEPNLGEYTEAAKQLGTDCGALMDLLTGDLAELSDKNTFIFKFIPNEWTNLHDACHVNHDALQEVLAEKVLPVFYAKTEELGLTA